MEQERKIYPFDKKKEWHHAIIRFGGRGSDGQKFRTEKEEAGQYAVEFEDAWREVTKKGVNYSLVVWHGYGRTDFQDKHKAHHIHVLFKYYKGSFLKATIEEFVSRHRFTLIYSPVQSGCSIKLLAKYLLQGKGRTVLCEAGVLPQGQVRDRDQCLRTEQEAAICEDDIRLEELRTPVSGHRNDKEEGNEGPRSRAGAKVREVVTMRKIEELMLKYRVKDETNLAMVLDPEERDWFDTESTTMREWNKIWIGARTNVMTKLKGMKWEEIMETLPDDPKAYHSSCMSIQRSAKVLKSILEKQGWKTEERMQFLRNVYAVMNNNLLGKKRNTLYLFGAVSAGKTLITKSLCKSVIFYFSTGEYNQRSSDFHFEDMLVARVASIEEPQIEAGKVDKFKVIMGGEEFDTSVKYKVKGKVSSVPVIISSNNEIYLYAPSARPAFEERWYRWDFNVNISDKVKITGCLHPKVWLELIKYYGLDQTDVSTDDSDSDFELSGFGGESDVRGNKPSSSAAAELEAAIKDLERDAGGGSDDELVRSILEDEGTRSPPIKRRRSTKKKADFSSSDEDDGTQRPPPDAKRKHGYSVSQEREIGLKCKRRLFTEEVSSPEERADSEPEIVDIETQPENAVSSQQRELYDLRTLKEFLQKGWIVCTCGAGRPERQEHCGCQESQEVDQVQLPAFDFKMINDVLKSTDPGNTFYVNGYELVTIDGMDTDNMQEVVKTLMILQSKFPGAGYDKLCPLYFTINDIE